MLPEERRLQIVEQVSVRPLVRADELAGLVVFVVMLLLEPDAMRAEAGAHGEEALEVADETATGEAPA